MKEGEKLRPDWKKFAKICIDKEVAPTVVFKELGFSQSSASEWKHGRNFPKSDKVKMIAEYLGVEVEELYTNV